MSLAPGTRLGPYDIVAPIGAGGMGEVYRAKDTKLNRDVAIKVLPDAFALDADRLARFTREAQVLASLNHPNIAAIYAVETTALVMELVEGEDLSAHIARGAMPLADVLAVATGIADALEAAHEQGIVHRDLKPQNVKIRADGTVKVLDFGLAKAMDPAGGSSADAVNSPTMTARATAMGMIIGTAAYMAPEQAKGRPADRRADVWAFGVVLFEMLTGRQVFQGETVSEVMASVMKDEPDWSRLPADLPSPLRRLLRRCLEKDPKRRLSSIGDARLELGEREPVTATTPTKRSLMPILVAAVAGVVLTAVVMWFALPSLRRAPDRTSAQVSVIGPDGLALAFDAAQSAISPDGKMIAFATTDAGGVNKLWVRPLDQPDARALAGTETAYLPFWSPDSRHIAFFVDGKLKRTPASGGTVEVICDARDGRGGTWGANDVIVFAPYVSGPLQRVAASGGEPKVVTALDTGQGETGHRFPSFLPDGRHFLFVALPVKNANYTISIGSIDDATRTSLLTAESSAVYAEPGYLLFPRKNALMAQRFDARRLAVSGEPIALAETPSSVSASFAASRPASASSDGTLVYLGDRLVNTKLRWYDRSGRDVGGLEALEGQYREISFSPDGRRVALSRNTGPHDSDIWIADVDRGGASRFTSAASNNNQEPVWSPDGARLAFVSLRNGPRDLFVKPSNGAAPEDVLYASGNQFKDVRSWSPDGKWIVFEQGDPKTSVDLWMLPMDGERTPKPYLRTPASEQYAAISPDGKWLAYSSDESGRYEIYVDSFPEPRSKYRVTDHGGVIATWRKDGRELAIVSADSRSVFVADVTAAADFHASAPRQVLSLPPGTQAVRPARDFQRFLASVPAIEGRTSSLTVIFDWVRALGKK